MVSLSQVLYCPWTTFKARETRILIQEKKKANKCHQSTKHFLLLTLEHQHHKARPL
ncbi:hypothetical protein OIU79_001011 [Salix purpurea]|uniref:Uncharacterized protein n=1 Tax=Salix purpurea TaxID=77065 RepID=A0A9Q0V3F0_SALPP|nr:hypothetical protein OIU79_001011 [Salix purpurea]